MKRHLASFRSGWRNEVLARFILSKFSFIAHPATVSDDIGSDFFCTLFQTHKEGSNEYLIPKSSFAIQIKSNKKDRDLSSKWSYLAELEIPFFIGLVDPKGLKLTIYSGEYIHPFSLEVKKPNQLKFELCAREDCQGNEWFVNQKNKSYVLRFPEVACIKINTEGQKLADQVTVLFKVCSLINKNITSKNNGEYIFREYDSSRLIIPLNKDYVRKTLFTRFSKLHHELAWIIERGYDVFDAKELEYYKKLVNQLGLQPIPEIIIDE